MIAGAEGVTPRARRREEVRDRVLAVVETLVEQGSSFAELSVETLAAEAGIARSTFYVYFEDKGDLLGAAIRAIGEEVENAASTWWSLDPPVTQEALSAALAELAAAYRPHATLLVAADDLASDHHSVREDIVGLRERLTAGLRRHIRRGQEEGWVDPELRPAETAAWLIGMTERGHQHVWMRQAPDEELPRILASFTTVIWRCLYEFAPVHRAGIPSD